MANSNRNIWRLQLSGMRRAMADPKCYQNYKIAEVSVHLTVHLTIPYFISLSLRMFEKTVLKGRLTAR